MKFIETKISDVIIIEPTVFGDTRGYFLESYNKRNLKKLLVITSLYKTMSRNHLKEYCGSSFSKTTF